MANLEVSRAERLDQRVVAMLPQLSRAYAAKLIEAKRVSVNGSSQVKPGYKMRAGDEVVVDYNPDLETEIPDIELEVLYEDDDLREITMHVPTLTTILRKLPNHKIHSHLHGAIATFHRHR